MIGNTTSAGAVLAVHRPHISWISIIGGWVVAMGVAWLFYVLGLAVGFSSFDVSDTDAVAKGIGIGTTAWVILTWAASLFIGAMFASWVDGRSDPTVGSLHGVAVWGLALTITAILTALGLSNFLQGTASLLGHGAAAAATAGTTGASQRPDTPLARAGSLLGAQVDRAVAQTPARTGSSAVAAQPSASGGGTSATTTSPMTSGQADARQAAGAIDAESRSAVALDLLRGRNDDAKSRLVASAGLQPSEADAVLQSVSPQVERLRGQIKEAAEQARRYTAAGMWAALLAGLISLVTAALGGWMGAGHIHRVHDNRRF
jgi:hypothetical protein